MVSFSSSTFVQTVSINYEDFNESFLTCGTCLCLYDAANHSPKLLPCSHTICRQCLEQIVSSNPIPVTMLTSNPAPATVQNNEEHQHAFRCPICRENIPLPAGGVAALRPNFLVNQLLDLMAQQRREVVPKCSVHSVQELLFCESCDMVFCQDCNGSSHSTTPELSEPHTVVPFSIAIKRMSEILLYKAKQCTKQLNEASGAVSAELAELDAHASATRAAVGAAFEEICDVVEERRQALMKDLDRMAIQKRAVLEAQMEEIRQERSLIEAEVDALHREVEVRSISGKISELTTKLETLGAVGEPRENSFLCFEPGSIRACLSAVRDCLSSFGAVRTSTTHPSLSSLVLPRCPVTNLECRAKVVTLDYDGRPRLTGNDPVEAKLFADGRELPVEVVDNEDGTYDLSFVPLAATEHRLEAKIFNRPLKDSPAFFVASPHINPEVSFGRRGRCDEEEFLQPVAAVYDGERKEILVLDSGNCRIKILSEERGEEDLLKCKRHVTEPSLEGASATGLAFCPDDGRVAVVNWRSRKITKFNVDGNGKRAEFTSDELKEPTGLAVASDGSVLVLDNSAGRVVLFSPEGKLERIVMLTNNASAVAFGPDDEPIVACDGNKIRIYQRSGVVREIAAPKTKGSGSFGGLAVTGDTLLASRSEKQRNCVMVFDYPTGKLRFVVDSPEERLRRPAGIAVLPGGRFLVVDWGNDCVRKYRYC